jgi:SAM-dependent methyltransferase
MGVFRREMDRRYWDGMAKKYEDEIFSVLHSDAKGLITQHLRRIASKGRSVADVGCGIGHFLPVLSKSFGRVYANDVSRELLERAKNRHKRLMNVSYLHGDIRSAFRRLPKVDCVVSVNSLISSSVGVRQRILLAISKILKPGGRLVLVVPSFESSLFVDVRFAQWKWHDGMSPARAVHSVYPKSPADDNKARQGILPIDGVATKHYLKEELRLLLSEVALKTLAVEKIEYGWDTEFEDPPRWMRQPYPWDWLVVARRGK